MPFGDGTGPNGLGPMTGRRMGRCAGTDYRYGNAPATPAYSYGPYPAPNEYRWRWPFARTFGRFFGRGYRSRGFGGRPGTGRGQGFGRGYGRYRW